MKSLKKLSFYLLNLLFCFGLSSPISGQNKDFKIIINEVDSLEGFAEQEAIKRFKTLKIPEFEYEAFLEKEKEEFIFKKYHSNLNGSVKTTNAAGNAFSCGDNPPTPYCTLPNNNVDFELGTTFNWTGYHGDFNHWTGSLGTSPTPFSSYLTPNSLAYKIGISPSSHRIVSNVSATDPYGNFPIVDAGGNYSLKLGNSKWGAESEIIQRKFTYNDNNPYVIFRYAIVMEDPGHSVVDQPFFEATIFDKNCNSIPCATLVSVANSNLPNFYKFPSGFYEGSYSVGGFYKPWSYAFFDLSKLSGVFANDDEYIVSFKTSDCALGAHFGYAYVELSCSVDNIIQMQGRKCIRKPIDFFAPSGNATTESYLWQLQKLNPSTNQYVNVTIPSGNPTNMFKFNYTFNEKGTYRIRLTYNLKNGCGSGSDFSEVFSIEDCSDDIVACEECIKSFSPLINESYSFDVWVKEDDIPIAYDNFINPGIQFLFNGVGSATEVFKPDGPIINGWQRISGKFTIPEGTIKLEIKLSNSFAGERDVYFDDLRIYPSRGSVKAFVYNPKTLQLMAQLDENNFATYYEYNQEGKAIRVKVETEKGVFSLKEQGSFLKRK